MQAILALLLCLSPAGAGVLDTSDHEIHLVFALLPLGWNLHTQSREDNGVWIEAPGDRYLITQDAPAVLSSPTFTLPHTDTILPSVLLMYAVVPASVVSLPFVPPFYRLRDGPPAQNSPRAPPRVTVKPLL